MKKVAIARAVLVTVITTMSLVAAGEGKMKVTTSAFPEDGNIPSRFTCDGADMSPALQITGVPLEAKSLVLIADDPDAPGGLFTHWLVWNIPPQTSSIAEGSSPQGVQGANDFGKTGYRGPCPPRGLHRYSFKIFALDRQLDLHAGAKRNQVDAAMKDHVIAHGELVGHYARKK